jgi:twinkle protein
MNYVIGESDDVLEDLFDPLLKDISQYRSYPMTSRGISQEVVDYFDVKMSVDPNGKPLAHYYPWTVNGSVAAYQERKLPKDFRTYGDFKNVELFGQRQATSGFTLVICEGAIDTMSVAQAYREKYGRNYSVVGVPSSSSTSCALGQRDWINSFKTVVIMMDQDEAGQKMTNFLGKMIKPGKAKVAKLPENDANETLMKHGWRTLIECIWNAQSWNPSGIVTGQPIWDQFIQRKNVECVPYPDCLSGLNKKLKGIRHGEITLFTSGTGSGKSTVIKEIILDLLSKTDDRIGLISLEESVGDTAEKFIGMALKKPLNEDTQPSEDELRQGFDEVFGDERLVLLDHQGSVGDDSLVDKIEYMALMGCKYLVLDHITIAVSEGSDGLTGNEAIDKFMSDLLKIVKRHNIWLGLISHLRKAQGGKAFEDGNIASIDDIKGSGSIKQISFDIIAFSRNLVAEDDYERNTVTFRVLKSRFTGQTGDAGCATYDTNTTRLLAKEEGFDYVNT